jgi:hypothetical protein
MTTKKTTLKSVFLTGLLVLVPLAITLWVLGLIIGTMDQTLLLLPESWQPERALGFRLPGLGAVLTLAFIFIVGLLTQNFIGQKLVKWWELLVGHIPVVGPIYTSVKQVSDTLLSSSGNAFRKALLIEYPRKGSYCGLVTEELMGQTVTLMRLGASPPRPRRRDLHRPARPRRPRAGRLRPGSRRDVQDAESVRNEFCLQVKSASCARARKARPTPT